MANYKLTQTGPEVQDLLNRIQDAKIEEGTITIGENSITPLTEETDPTVPSWAKQPSKPTYTASEIGAISSETLALAQIPTDGTYSRSEFESAYCAVSELLKVVDGEYRFASVDYDNGASVVTREVPVGGSSTETMGETDCTVSLLDGSVAVYISFNREDGNITVSTVAVTAYDIAAWNAKYDKPSGGIPKTDLASAVQASLDKADNAVRFNASQDLTTQQKLTARRNISALGEDEVQMVYRGYQTEPGFEGKEGDIYISDGEYISISPTYTEGWGRWYMVRSYNVSSFSGGHRIKVTNIRLGPFGGSIRYVDANDNTIEVDIDDSEFFCPIGTKTVTITADEAGSYPSADFYQEFSPSSLKEYHDGGWVNHVPFSGDYNDLTNKPDLTQFVTTSVNNLVNYYLKSETYTKAEVQQLIAAVQGVTFVSVATLPAASSDTMGGKIYLVPSSNPKTQNVKDEYITIESEESYSWEQIGSTEASLDGYVTDAELNAALADYTTTSDLTTLLAAKQDVISDLATIRSDAAAGATAYQKPASGIPASDLADGVIPDVSGLYEKPSGGIPKTDLASDVQTSLGKADSALQSFTETDPTVPAWAKEAQKPSYTAQEVGALPANTSIPSALSDLSEDTTHRVVTDTEKSTWNGKQDAIADLSTIRSGASAGATAYQKPEDGIPKTDLAQGVQTSLDRADTAVRYVEHQGLTDSQKSNARQNIGAMGEDKAQVVYRGDSAEPSISGKEGDIYIGGGGYTQVYPTYTDSGSMWSNTRTYNVAPYSESNRIKVSNISSMGGGFAWCVDANDNYIDLYELDFVDGGYICPVGTKSVSFESDLEYATADFHQEPNTSSFLEYHNGAWVVRNPFSGSYNDLTDKPTIPAAQVNSDWNASSGVAQILNKPTIPDAVEANPTVPSGTTPTAMTGMKIGSSYYSVAATPTSMTNNEIDTAVNNAWV